MVRHLVAWNFKEDLNPEQRENHARSLKTEMEALPALIPGIVSIQVRIKPLASGDRDVMLDGLFESEEALAAYMVHPEHKKACRLLDACQDRFCLDFIE